VRKILQIGLWTLAVVVVLTAGLLVYLRNADLSIYEEQIETFLSSRIGHELTIGGRFELHFGTVTRLVAEDVALSNPGWQSNPTLVQVGHLTIAVDTWSVLSDPFVVEELQVREITAYLEKDADGRTNWTPRIVREQQDSGGAFDTDRIAFKEVRIESIELEIIDPAMRRPINATIGHLTISPDVNDILDLDLQGTANEMPLWADGKLGPWQNFLDGRDITADFDLTLGPVSLTLRGSVDDLTNLEGVELNGVFSGPEIEHVLDRLGLPPLAAGKFEVGADVRATRFVSTEISVRSTYLRAAISIACSIRRRRVTTSVYPDPMFVPSPNYLVSTECPEAHSRLRVTTPGTLVFSHSRIRWFGSVRTQCR